MGVYMKKNIIVVGGGAGGLELAVGLAKKYRKIYKITLIDKEKTHIWKPHLHELASGSKNQHSEQLDYLHLANKFDFEFVWGEMSELNKETKTVTLKQTYNMSGEEILPIRHLTYDNLIIAVGSSSNDFNTPGVREYSFSLDNLEAASLFHETMLEKILKKEYDSADHENFKVTIVGGGATGVELAAELTETTRQISQFGLHKLKSKPIKITVVNAADQLLPGLSQKISDGAKAILEEADVAVLNSAKVIALEKNKAIIEYQGEKIELSSDLQVWAAGVKSPDFLSKLGLETNRVNQFTVNGQLQTSDKSIFALGDCACAKWVNAPKEGMNVPPRAQSAHQMSDYLIKYLDKINNGMSVPDFVYKDFGSLISLGSGETVGTLMGFLKGRHLFVEGKVAKLMYIHLYQHHQIKINGFIPAFFLLIGKLIQKRFKPLVKLH
jgi:NADH:ubiquinone reductase (H+-translocating)